MPITRDEEETAGHVELAKIRSSRIKHQAAGVLSFRGVTSC